MQFKYRKEGNRKPLSGEYHRNNYLRQDPLMKIKINDKNTQNKNICIVTKYLSQDIYQQQNEKNQ